MGEHAGWMSGIGELTEPWAILLSGVSTLVAALIVAIVGPWLLSGKFENLDDAAQKAREAAEKVRDRLSELEAELGGYARALANVQNTLTDAAEDRKAAEAEEHQAGAAAADVAPPLREQLRELWTEVRSKVEDMASSPQIDGKTKAKYARIDRRSYRRLLEAMREDGALGAEPQTYFDALDLWSRYRANRAEATQQDLNAMRALRNTILGMPGFIPLAPAA